MLDQMEYFEVRNRRKLMEIGQQVTVVRIRHLQSIDAFDACHQFMQCTSARGRTLTRNYTGRSRR